MRERDVGCLQAAGQGRGVVALRNWNLLKLDAGSPKVGRFLSLCYSIGSDFGVGPCYGSVAVTDRPVALFLSVSLKYRTIWNNNLTFHAGVP